MAGPMQLETQLPRPLSGEHGKEHSGFLVLTMRNKTLTQKGDNACPPLLTGGNCLWQGLGALPHAGFIDGKHADIQIFSGGF